MQKSYQKDVAHLQDVSSTELGDVKSIAVSAVTEFIASPDVFQFDLYSAPVLKQLEGDSRHAALYKLLGIVLDGDVKVVPLPRFCSSSLPCVEHISMHCKLPASLEGTAASQV